MQAKTTISY